MPILDVEIVNYPGEALPSSLARDLADRAGAIFGSPTGGTWVRLRSLPVEFYAENLVEPAQTPLPVFVAILRAALPPPEKMEAEIAQLTQAIAEICRRPADNVHLLYLPPGAGRVSFGGRLVRE